MFFKKKKLSGVPKYEIILKIRERKMSKNFCVIHAHEHTCLDMYASFRAVNSRRSKVQILTRT